MRTSLAFFTAVTMAVGVCAPGGCGGDTSPGGGAAGSGSQAGSTHRGGSGNGWGGTGGSFARAGSGGTDTACQVAADCGWGEIDHEILSRPDCICLFGCPYLPLNQATVTRRLAQYQSLCDPSVDGQGQPCPVDECMRPPEPVCVDNTCGPLDPWG